MGTEFRMEGISVTGIGSWTLQGVYGTRGWPRESCIHDFIFLALSTLDLLCNLRLHALVSS